MTGFGGTPVQYAITVNSYSERPKEAFLHAGLHYRRLAQFLRPAQTPRPVTPSAPAPFIHVVVHDWSKTGRIPNCYDTESGLQNLAQLPPPEPGKVRLIFLRGYSSRDWILQLGAQYRIHPEYFRRHLDFLQPQEFYDLPTLPSSSRNVLQLRIVTICTREVAFTQEQIENSRIEEIKAVKTHQRHLGETAGESIIRRYSIHGESIFTLEQEVSLCIKRKNGGCVGM